MINIFKGRTKLWNDLYKEWTNVNRKIGKRISYWDGEIGSGTLFMEHIGYVDEKKI